MLKFISCSSSCLRAKAPHRFLQTDGDLIRSNLIDLWMRKAFLFMPVCLLSKNESLRVAETTRNNGNTRRKSSPVFFCFLGWPANDSDMRRGWIFSRQLDQNVGCLWLLAFCWKKIFCVAKNLETPSVLSFSFWKRAPQHPVFSLLEVSKSFLIYLLLFSLF